MVAGAKNLIGSHMACLKILVNFFQVAGLTMIQNPNRIKAKYDGSDLVVIACSQAFPSWKTCQSMPFMACLTFLSAQDNQDWVDGWRAVRAFFSDYEITIEMESFKIQKGTLFPMYLVQKNDLSFKEKFNKPFIEKFKQPYIQAGWRELATSNPLVSRMSSLSVLTLWTKESLSGLRLA